MNIKDQFVHFLVEAGALKFGNFVTKSGRETPYFINTGMFEGIRSKVFKIQKPEKVAAKTIRAIEKNRIFIGIPFGFHFIRLMQGIFPFRLFDPFFGHLFGLYTVMDHYTGRKK